jgi:hypothetical protein
MFAGRRSELSILEQALESACSGSGGTFLIEGQAGIGKTSLAGRLVELAEQREIFVAAGRAWQGPGVPPLWLWLDALRAAEEPLILPRSLATDEARFACFEQISAHVRMLAASRPLLLFLDDLHWADAASLLALRLVARLPRGNRVLVVGTAREPHDAPPDVARALADVRREATVMRLEALQRDDLAVLAEARGMDGTRAAAALERITGGHPLSVTEILTDPAARRAIEEGREPPVPRAIGELLGVHFERLTAAHRDLLSWIAVGGEPIDAGLVSDASGATSTEIAAAVAAARAEGVFSRGEVRPRFVHDLFRMAAYESIALDRRAEMHRAYAAALARRSGSEVARAQHLFSADPAASSTDAAAAALAAARVAIARFAFEDAAAFAERAAHAYERCGRHGQQAIALAVLAEGRMLAGDLDGWSAAAEDALSVARQADEAIPFANAALAFGLRRQLALSSSRLVMTLDDALSRLDRAGIDDVAMRCALEARLGAALQPELDPPRALLNARRSIDRARATGDPQLIARTIHAARPAFRILEPHDERVGFDRELLALSEDLGDPVLEAHARGRLYWCALEGGDPDAADVHLVAFEELAGSLGVAAHELGALAARATREAMQGRWNGAESAVNTIERTPELRTLARAAIIDIVGCLKFTIAFARDDYADVTSPFDGIQAPPAPVKAAFEALFAARAGRIEPARNAFVRVADRVLSGDPPFTARHILGDTCVGVRSVEHAARCYELLAPFSGRHIVFTPLPGYDGAVDRVLGGLAALAGDSSAARVHFDAAIEAEHRLGAAPFAERTERTRRELLGAPSRRAPSAQSPSFVRDGDTWLVALGAERARLRNVDGFVYLAYLVERPDVPVPVAELFAARGTGAAATDGDAGEPLDRQAIATYRSRARELRGDLAEAEARNDLGAMDAAQRELAFLEQELSRAVGLGGRGRRAASAHERLRVNVTTRIRKAIERLRASAPALAHHLDTSVRTGSTCVYRRAPDGA